MKIDRFWKIQFVIIGVLLSLLIGSYLFSFGLFSPSTSRTPPPQAEADTPPAEPAKASTLVEAQPPAPTPVASCVPTGVMPTPTAIADSLASPDPVRQKNCLAFLQAESQAGDKGAELWLGRAYHNGWGVAKDLPQAATHYRQAMQASEADTRESAQQWLRLLEQEQ